MNTPVFKRIALALGFSPRMEALMAETASIAKALNASVHLVHVGSATAEDRQRLNEAMYLLEGVQTDTFFIEGDIVDSLLEHCKLKHIDLLIAGALEREGLVRYYLGSVARTICRKAPCSVLMLTEPSLKPSGFKSISASASHHNESPVILEKALNLAEAFHSEILSLVVEEHVHQLAVTLDDELESGSNSFPQIQFENLQPLVNHCRLAGTNVDWVFREGKSGHCISTYARENKSDLLIVAAPQKELSLFDRIFQHDIEYALANLPCSLLTVHS